MITDDFYKSPFYRLLTFVTSNFKRIRNMRKLVKLIMLVFVILFVVFPCKAEGYGKYYQGLPFDIPKAVTPAIPELEVSLAEYGGIGNGMTLNTQAFAAAIADLSERGGGHLIVPEGIWLTGPIVLKSNIDLHVLKNAIVLFTPDKTQYPLLSPDEGTSGSRCQSPISAYHESNFSITGEGVFDGNGEFWRPVKRFKVSNAEWNSFIKTGGTVQQDGAVWYPETSSEKLAKKRPRMVRFVRCERVLLQGVVFQNSPSFHVNFILSDNIVVDGIMVRCPWNAQNGDGIDLSSCTNALIVNCAVDAGDDAICLKSGIGDVGRRRGPCANIIIDNCTVFHGHGGFVIGSDTGGGIDRVSVRNCRFIDTDTGLRFKSKRGRGGVVSNVYVDNIMMNDIANYAIWFDSYYQEKTPEPDGIPEGGEMTDVPFMPVTDDTPCFQDIHISNITCRDAGRAMFFNGLPEMNVSNVSLTDCMIHSVAGAQVDETCGLRMENIHLDVAEGPVLSFNNSKDIEVKDLVYAGNGEQKVRVFGSRNRNIKIKGGKFCIDDVLFTPKAKKAITID